MRQYAERFTKPEQASAYDAGEYGPESYSAFIWSLQRPYLTSILQRQKNKIGKLHLLDFACGTGRVLSAVEKIADQSDGVDVSSAMIERAAAKCVNSRLLVGDIATDQALVHGPYDVITAFRFFLNTEPEVRVAALRALHSRLHPDHGFLVANVHGNARSLRHFPLMYRKWREARSKNGITKEEPMLAEIEPDEMIDVFRRGGFAVMDQLGFGLFPEFVHRMSPLRWLAQGADRISAGAALVKNIAIDLLFVCKPIKPSCANS